MNRVRQLRERAVYAWSIRRQWGMTRFLALALRGVLELVVAWRTVDLFERDLTEANAPFEPALPLEIRVAEDSDFVRFRDTLLREDTTRSELARRRAAGDLCFIGVSEGRLVHFTWLVRRRRVWLPDLGAMLDLEPDAAYVPFSYTERAMRGRSVQAAVTRFMIEWEQRHGLRRHYYLVMRENTPGRAIVRGRHVGSPAKLLRTVRTVRIALLPGFLVRGLDEGGRPRLEPARPLDLRALGLWVRPPSDATPS
jgi:GNAT superfamily N-acetyltransferase